MSSFFGSNANTGPSPLTLAKVEAEVLTEMFNKMAITCNKKCVVKYNESDLSVGEMACVDRCVSKYMQAQEKVGDVLNKFEQQLKAQEQAGLQTYQFKPNT